MGPGIIIPLLVITIVVPVAIMWATKTFKSGGQSGTADAVGPPSARLTSNALRELPAPPWRIVYEIAGDKMGGVEHVLIGPPGIFALETSMEPLPPAPTGAPDAHEVAQVAIARGGLDDVLRRCAMSSDRLIQVHWGQRDGDQQPIAVELLAGATAVDGRSLAQWAAGLDGITLTPAQVDLAWQTVLTGIGRPDPLA